MKSPQAQKVRGDGGVNEIYRSYFRRGRKYDSKKEVDVGHCWIQYFEEC